MSFSAAYCALVYEKFPSMLGNICRKWPWTTSMALSLSSFLRTSWGRRRLDRATDLMILAARAGSAYFAFAGRFCRFHASSFCDKSFFFLVNNFGILVLFTLPVTYCNSAATNWYGRWRRRPPSLPRFTDLKWDSTAALVWHVGEVLAAADIASLDWSLPNRLTSFWKTADQRG